MSFPKAVIFDFDGVILESADIKTEAFLELFSDHPEHREAILAHHLDNQGISRYRKFEWIYAELLGKTLDEEESERLGTGFSDLVMARILECGFVPGALDCLESISSRSLLFVASGTPQEELEIIVERRGLSRFFTEIWGTPREKSEIIRSILRRFGLEPGEVVFIGDGESDFRAAMETGVPFLAREVASSPIRWEELGAVAFPDLAAIHLHLEGASARAGS